MDIRDPVAMNDILIVDDTPDNLTVLMQMLTERGYQVRPALSGEIALNAVKAELPDLILLDIMMPGIDGFEVCSKLQSDERTQNIPIIFISALGETEDKVKGFQAGGVDYIIKPFQAEEVLARVASHLALKNMQLQLQREVEERKHAEKALQKAHDELDRRIADRTAELDRKSKMLMEVNAALNVLLQKREEDKKELEEKVIFNIEKLILPYLEKLEMTHQNEFPESILEIIRSNLNEITSSFTHDYKSYLSKLTPAQIQVANLIRQGKTTKEIASFLHLSPATVACHRQEIRKRLSLSNKKINLQAALTANPQNN